MVKYRLAWQKPAFAFLSWILLVLPFTAHGQSPIRDLKPTIILISLDGFRHDYIEKYQAVNLGKLAEDGVRAQWLIPSFPSNTFPNHYSIVTGLYPSEHGIVDNNIFDFGTVFSINRREEVENPRWWGGEPIWVTAESQGQIAASFFWVGSETKIKGRQPTYWHRYDDNIANEARVEGVLSWLDLPVEKRPTVITLYFGDTDKAGHEFGPESNEVRQAVKKVDGDIERLMVGLKKRDIDDKVNIVIVSDHGMTTVEANRIVFMRQALRDEWMQQDPIMSSVLWQIFPKPEYEEQVMTALAQLKNTSCWKKSQIPERFKYKDGERVAPVICLADVGWAMVKDRKESVNLFSKRKVRGAHGFDNAHQEMQATFVAHGPRFKKQTVVVPFENVEIYNIMCEILGLKPAPNSGNLGRVQELLR